MKTEYVTLFAATIAAVASVSGVVFDQLGSLNLEREKWEQSQKDAHRALVADFAKELATVLQHAELLVWRAANAPDQITDADFRTYDSAAKSALPRIFTYRVQLTAKEPNVYPNLEPVVKGYYAADECIALSAVAFQRNPPDGVAKLSACAKPVRSVTNAMNAMDESFSVAMKAVL